jgi:hypothetical protein
MVGRLIFEDEDGDEHEGESVRKKARFPTIKITEVSEKKHRHPDRIDRRKNRQAGDEGEPLFEFFATSLFKNPSSRSPV